MKLGLIAYGGEQDFPKAKEKGLDFVEFCLNDDGNDCHREFAEHAGETRKKLDALGLFTGSVGRWGGTKLSGDGTIREEEFQADRRLIEAAKTLGCRTYVTGCNYVENLSLYENYTAAIGYFQKLLALGREHGVEIAVYNCRWNNYIVNDPAWSVVLGHLPDLKIKFDPSHCIYDGGDYLAEIQKWGRRFGHVHIKGVLLAAGKRVDDPPAGLDAINWGAFMASLYAVGYNGTLSIEPHSEIWKNELGEKGLDFTVQMMKKMIF